MANKKYIFVLSAIICMMGWSFSGTYGGGSGMPEDPYLLSNPAHLVELSVTEADWRWDFV